MLCLAPCPSTEVHMLLLLLPQNQNSTNFTSVSHTPTYFTAYSCHLNTHPTLSLHSPMSHKPFRFPCIKEQPGGLCILQAPGCFLRSIQVWGVKEVKRGVSASPPALGLRASHGRRRQRPVSPCISPTSLPLRCCIGKEVNCLCTAMTQPCRGLCQTTMTPPAHRLLLRSFGKL